MLGPETVDVLAQGLSTDKLQNFLSENVLSLLVMVVGLGMLIAGGKRDASKVMTTAGLALVALAVVGMSFVPDGPEATAKFLWSLVSGA